MSMKNKRPFYLSAAKFRRHLVKEIPAKDPWNDLPASLQYMQPFKAMWPKIKENRAALRIFYMVI